MKRQITLSGLFLVSVLAFGSESPPTMRALSAEPVSPVDYYYVWAVDLDDRLGDEYVVASGYADGIDYSIYRNFKNEKSLVFRFSPVLIDSSNKAEPFYWGYPWDIANIVTKKEGARTRILCSFDHGISRAEEIDTPKWQLRMPAIFFTGVSTQPESAVSTIKKQEWLTLDEIRKRVREKRQR